MKALIALLGSILKWVKIAFFKEHDKGIHNCALCKLYHINRNNAVRVGCENCPVFIKTREAVCCGTPCTERYEYDEINPKRCQILAIKELFFLISLLPATIRRMLKAEIKRLEEKLKRLKTGEGG